MQAVDQPVLEFLRQHDLALRQVAHLPPQCRFARESGLQFSHRYAQFFFEWRLAEQRQCVGGERALQQMLYFHSPISRARPTSFGAEAGAYQRLPQLPRHPPPPRTSLMTNSRTSAPMVALTIAATMPVPRWMPS